MLCLYVIVFNFIFIYCIYIYANNTYVNNNKCRKKYNYYIKK